MLYDARLERYTDLNSEAQKALQLVNLYREATDSAATADQLRYEALARHVQGLPKHVPVAVDIDTAAADKQVERWLTGSRRVLEVKLQAMDRQGRPIP
ncbi:MAG: hypothetical protein EAS51_12785, partial [Microbacteriaceae bacterium]